MLQGDIGVLGGLRPPNTPISSLLSRRFPMNQSLLDPDSYRCVRANDIYQINVIKQLDLDRDQLDYLGIRTGGCRADG
jgi:hypothetical protein